MNRSEGQFLEELRQQWNQNPVVAILNARLNPIRIPVDTIQIAINMQQKAQQSAESFRQWQNTQESVNLTLGAMGIFGGGSNFSSGFGTGFNEPNVDELMFYQTMATIRNSVDNPQPTLPALESQAVAVLQGKVDPMQVYVLMDNQIPGYGQLPQGLLQMLGSMLGGVPPIFQKQALILAALAVPREQIPTLLGIENVENKANEIIKKQANQERPHELLDDLAKVRCFNEISQRSLQEQFNTMPEKVNKTVVESLKRILADYEQLLQSGPPEYPYYTVEDVKNRIADTTEFIGRAYESLGEIEQAKNYYQRAANQFKEIGQDQKSQNCENNLAQLINYDRGNVDLEIKRLYSALETLPEKTLAHIKVLIELAELLSQNDDDYKAEKLLKTAEKELDESQGQPSGTDIAKALTQSLQMIQSGENFQQESPIETKILVRGLYMRLYSCLVRIYGRKGAQENFESYQKKLDQMGKQEINQDFSEQMQKVLHLLL